MVSSNCDKQKNGMKILRPIIKCHGGKYYSQRWIRSFFPAHHKFIEWCGGAGSVVINKCDAAINVYNELNPDIFWIFYHLEHNPSWLGSVERIEYSEERFQAAKNDKPKFHIGSEGRALCEFIIRRMSRGGLCKDFAWSDRERGGRPGEINSWENMKKELPLIKQRLKHINVTNENVLQTLNWHTDKDTLHYIDPPYPLCTRTHKASYGEYDWTDEMHETLCQIANIHPSKIMISSYENEIYNTYLKSWRIERKEMPNHSGQGKKKERRTEVLYMNF